MTPQAMPPADGLYDPRFEHDACGVALVARLDNRPTHQVVDQALTALENLEHRGAAGADKHTGDGAGMLVQMLDRFLRSGVDFELPEPGRYGVAMCFLPRDAARREKLEALLERNVRIEGQIVLGWRDVPIDEKHVGTTANSTRTEIRQLFIAAGPGFMDDQDAFERKLYVIRRVVELAAGPHFYLASCSSRALVYKGMLIAHQVRHGLYPDLLDERFPSAMALGASRLSTDTFPRLELAPPYPAVGHQVRNGFYPDLLDERFASAMALVHSRFSTNTFPSWELAHPYRVIAHNGEINTLMGNVNWMRARESQLASQLFGGDLQKILPIVRPGAATAPRSTTSSSCSCSPAARCRTR